MAVAVLASTCLAFGMMSLISRDCVVLAMDGFESIPSFLPSFLPFEVGTSYTFKRNIFLHEKTSRATTHAVPAINTSHLKRVVDAAGACTC